MGRLTLTCLLFAASSIVAANAAHFELRMIAAGIALVLILAAAWVLLPVNRQHRRNGRYLAIVSLMEYGRPNQIWSGQFATYVGALIASRRVALREDYLGDVYSEFAVTTEVVDLKQAGHGIAFAGAAE